MDSLATWFLAGLVIANVITGFTLYRAHLKKLENLRVYRNRCMFALETAPDAFWDWNIFTSEFYFSPGFFRIFGQKNRYPLNPFDLYSEQVHPEDRERTIKLFRTSIDHCATHFRQEFRQLSADGDYRHILLNGAVVEANSQGIATRVVAWLTDITESREMENRYRQAAQKAEITTHLKNNILSTLSHEIRTPMNAISGLSHLVLQTDLNPQQQELIDNIDKSGRKLLDTINDIFEFSSLESRKILIEIRDFHLYDIFEPVVDFFHFREVQSDIDILFEIDPSVPMTLSGDALRTGQVLRHLSVMVLEKSPNKQCVIAVRLHGKQSHSLILEFSVRGTGLPDAPKPIKGSINSSGFGTFDNRQNKSKSEAGLSLMICNQLIDLMGGEFHSSPSDLHHTRFQFRLSYERKETFLTQSRYFCPAELVGAKILIFEPDLSVRKSLCLLLESFGFQTMVCDSIATAKTISSAPRGKPFEMIIVSGKVFSDPDNKAIEELKQFSLETGLKIMVTLSGIDHTRYSDIDGDIRTGSRLIKPLSPSMLFKSVCRVLTREIEPESISLETSNRKQQAPQILLVEDNRVNQQIAEELLDQLGTVVQIATNGVEAIRQINSTNFDLVFMDIQMPEMDGITATQSVRQQTRFENLPIIAMTAHATQRDREQALTAGMNDFISKPIDGLKLHRMLCRWLPWADFNPITASDIRESDPVLYKNWSEINYAAGLIHVGQNAVLYNRLLGEFYRDHHRDAEIINNALLNGDTETAHRLTHTLSGIAANIAANELYLSAQTLNNAIDSENRDTIRTCFTEFSAVFDRAMSELKVHTEIHSKLTTQSINIKPSRKSVDQLLCRMDTLLGQGDSEVLDLMDEIEKSLKSFKMDTEIDELSSQLSYFLFDEARQTLAKIANSLDIELSE